MNISRIPLPVLVCVCLLAVPVVAEGSTGQDISAELNATIQGANAQAEVHGQAQITSEENAQVTQQKQACKQEQAKNGTHLQVMVQERTVAANHNSIQVALFTFSSAQGMAGDEAQQMNQTTRQLNNSFRVSLQAEERIRSQNGIVKFFFGGDREAAARINEESENIRVQLREMNRIIAACNCDAGARVVLQQQVQVMEQEQLRLDALAKAEIKEKGLLGGIF